ncbi:MAG: cupredoxin domain-containing protein [Candidatus Pacebacteria bacterium]|jgi:plastocyanin|nr:cupredoxin domain-containing protein [Candidatus Paceibacterota bacterium]
MDTKNIYPIAGILILIIGGLIYFWLNMPDKTAENVVGTIAEKIDYSDNTSTGTPSNTAASDTSSEVYEVSYSDTGFSPKTITIKAGDTIKFTNNSSGTKMWVASDPHPAHTDYSETPRDTHCPDTAENAFDQCSDGKAYSFTFDKIGTWEYHNHLLAADRGEVIVTQ